MERIAKKMARIEAAQNDEPEPIVEQPVESVSVKPQVAPKKEKTPKKVAAKTKPKPRGRPKGSKKRK